MYMYMYVSNVSKKMRLCKLSKEVSWRKLRVADGLFSLAQRSLCPVGMCLEIIVSSWHVPLRDHEVTVSLAQRSLCPVGMCLKRS